MEAKIPVEPLTLTVLQGSVRAERVGPAVTDWVLERLGSAEEFTVDAIDLAKVRLPEPTELRPGGAGVRSEIADRLEVADAFVIISPEYNRSFPGALKHAIDCHYREWMFKPVLLVTYGVTGGIAAAEQLRAVFAELHAVTARRVVAVNAPWTRLDPDGRLTHCDQLEHMLTVGRSELVWWGEALRRQRRLRPYQELR